MRIFWILLILLFLQACTKPVYTEYFEDENYTMFTTHKIEVSNPETGHDLVMVASRRCPGQTLCTADEIKFELKHQEKFAFLKGRDFTIDADGENINLNRREYDFSYDTKITAKDGTQGVAVERWLLWLSIDDFQKMGAAKELILNVGPYRIPMDLESRQNWRTLIDHPMLIETLEDEQRRAYVDYVSTPATEAKRREKFEKKARIESEEATWELIKNSDSAEDIKFFLETYPDSPYAVPARLKLKQLERKTVSE